PGSERASGPSGPKTASISGIYNIMFGIAAAGCGHRALATDIFAIKARKPRTRRYNSPSLASIGPTRIRYGDCSPHARSAPANCQKCSRMGGRGPGAHSARSGLLVRWNAPGIRTLAPRAARQGRAEGAESGDFSGLLSIPLGTE